MSRYCKAYPVSRLREYEGWAASARAVRAARPGRLDGSPTLEDSDILYLQEDFTVTGGIFMNEDIIFDDLTPDWTAFCKERLRFSPPEIG
ncbi:MAG TPA: hypothetical protein VF621_14245 [Pyrinomonadaceae bacterium]|jgi:hypothetical protein